MEQQQHRKIGGEDRISELPECLLLHILSLLPTEIAIGTSVLSKRWRSLWKVLPNLKFDSCYHQYDYRFSENLCRSLVLYKAPVLESLHLEVGHKCDAFELGLWIGIAFSRHVRKLVLDFQFDEKGFVHFSRDLGRCHNTLEILELKYNILIDLRLPVCFESLRELHLYLVEFEDEESVSNLFSGCPCLEDLVVYRNCNADVANFIIEVPSLQRLTIEVVCSGMGDGGYVINAPALKYLDINEFHDLEFCLIEKAPELLEAKLCHVSKIVDENILETLTPAKRLSLDLSPLHVIFRFLTFSRGFLCKWALTLFLCTKYPTGIIFHQLVSLELYTGGKEWWHILLLMLNNSPKLQILKLIDSWWHSDKGYLVDQKWNQPKCVSECLLFHLETFEWTGYEWQREDEKEVATFILKNARLLKKATLSTKPIKSRELEKLEERREMLNDLASVARASNSCHLVFKTL